MCFRDFPGTPNLQWCNNLISFGEEGGELWHPSYEPGSMVQVRPELRPQSRPDRGEGSRSLSTVPHRACYASLKDAADDAGGWECGMRIDSRPGDDGELERCKDWILGVLHVRLHVCPSA